MLCDYGCHKEALFDLKNGKKCCSEKHQQCENIKLKNSNGLKESHRKGLGYKFTDVDRKKSNLKQNQTTFENALINVFVKNSTASNKCVKPKFEKIVEYKCNICNISEWNNSKIVLELDHINGINTDNSLENLRLLCPNCHSQTENFRGRNINTGKNKVTDEELLIALLETKNIRQALLKVGLTPKGANYDKAYRIKTNLSV